MQENILKGLDLYNETWSEVIEVLSQLYQANKEWQGDTLPWQKKKVMYILSWFTIQSTSFLRSIVLFMLICSI